MKNDITDIIKKLAELSHLEFIVNLKIIEEAFYIASEKLEII